MVDQQLNDLHEQIVEQNEMLSKELKESAVEAFRLPDPDATDSTTASESEWERLERYPGPPSPRSSSIRLRERLSELGPKLPIRGRIGGKLPVQGDDGGTAMDVLYRKTHGKPRRKRAQARKELGTSAVIIDPQPDTSEFDVEDTNVYKAWQVGRQAQIKLDAEHSHVEEDVTTPLSHLGLFALLPGELRNRVYRNTVLTELPEPFLIALQPGTCSLGPCVHSKLPTAVPGLLSACRQIRHEAMPIFCAENTFKFDDKTVRERCVGNWLRCLGPYGRLLPAITLEILVWEPMWPNSTEKIGRPYQVKIECNREEGLNPITLPHLLVDPEIRLKEKSMCDQLLEHMVKLRARAVHGEGERSEALEGLLHEFVSSDWLAELVYRCKK